MVVLSALDDLDQIGLAKTMGIDRSTTALVVGKLEAAGLVERVSDPQDRRRKVLHLTERGRVTLTALAEPAARARGRLLVAFNEAEATRFVTLLDRFVLAFNGEARAPLSAPASEA